MRIPSHWSCFRFFGGLRTAVLLPEGALPVGLGLKVYPFSVRERGLGVHFRKNRAKPQVPKRLQVLLLGCMLGIAGASVSGDSPSGSTGIRTPAEGARILFYNAGAAVISGTASCRNSPVSPSTNGTKKFSSVRNSPEDLALQQTRALSPASELKPPDHDDESPALHPKLEVVIHSSARYSTSTNVFLLLSDATRHHS